MTSASGFPLANLCGSLITFSCMYILLSSHSCAKKLIQRTQVKQTIQSVLKAYGKQPKKTG